MSNLFGQATGSAFGSSTQQSASPFGSSLTNTAQSKPSGLFGSLGTSTNTSQGQQAGSLFSSLGNTTQQQQGGGGLFGSSAQPQQSGSLFGAPAQPQQQSGSLFGAPAQPQQQSGSLFGAPAQPQQHSGSLFGAPAQPQQQSGSLFGAPAQPQQQSGGVFGSWGQSTQQQPQQQQQQQQGGGLFGNLGQSTQQQQSGGTFGGLGQSTQQQQPQAQTNGLLGQSQSLGQSLGQSQSQSLGSIWQPGSGLTPRQKTIPEQMKLLFDKWDPDSPNTLFQTYLYNHVPEVQAPFYRPGPQDDEAKWEEALQKRPSPGAIPVLVKGFYQLGQRLVLQKRHLDILQGRLHEINNSLTAMLQNHDLIIAIRAADCRRKHVALSHRCLALATKVQILRNRGYAMDSAEEELRKKLMALEKGVCDSALNGRGEEIWARLLAVRQRARQLQAEFGKSSKGLANGGGTELDEEVAKKAKKILEDYDVQLSHLNKELAQIQKDLADWEGTNSGSNGKENAKRSR